VLTVMTRNLFLGADLAPVYDALAAGPAAVPAAVAGVFNPGRPPGAVQRTDFGRRAVGLAADVAAARPDLIGLQEAAVWRTRSLSADEPAATHDHLDVLEAELARRGLRYRRVVTAAVGDVELPSAAGISVGLTNRLAILAREDRVGLSLADAHSGSFANTLPIATQMGTFALPRGWVSVDVELAQATLRFITTHLEVPSSAAGAEAQLRQADELLAGPADTARPVVLAGDFNARPGRPAYQSLRAGGFEDAWTGAESDRRDGHTCCHAMPLDDPESGLRSRVDLILTRGALTAKEVYVIDEFRSGLWASDHAGVVARLQTVAGG
jgi:endonuclease/exonuclease/phosphatase family metal-dependent hydrolase